MSADDEAEEHAGQALDQLLEVTVLLAGDMQRGLAAQGLNETRAHLLFALHAGGPTTQRVLAEALDVAPRTVTALVDALSEAGLVTREPHPTDRRATHVTLTPSGATVAGGLVDGRAELATQLFGGWRAEDLVGLTSGLDVLLDSLRALVDDPS